MQAVSKPSSFLAFACRSLALLAVLSQLRLLAGVLADTALFASSLAFGLFVPALLRRRKLSTLQSLAVLLLLPWTARLLLALPRWILPAAVFWDSLLLSFDRNNFVSLLPYYWMALSGYFSLNSRAFLRFDVLAQGFLTTGIFLLARSSAVYRLPVLVLALFGGVVFLQILAFILSTDPAYRVRSGECFAGAGAMLVLIVLGACLLIRPSEEKAGDQSGGLLQPKLFNFDFSQFLRLESEISMNTDLVLIVRKEDDEDHILLRRFILSGYSPRRGFYFDEGRDEAEHPRRLPEKQWLFDEGRTAGSGAPVYSGNGPFKTVNQEYYLVNFDSRALIGLNRIEEVLPFETWDASSFNSAYAVKSRVCDALPFELAAIDSLSPETGLDSDMYRYYTDYGEDPRIKMLAEAFSQGAAGCGDRAAMIYDALKYGDYRYSLKPGIAPDGDQLGYFLFDVKKGYCSYFAFSMTLLLRSLGIPARVAVGFYVDVEAGALGYYPVRQDMAHAWTEAWFPGYGWIEFDPTSPFVAAGEEFRINSGIPAEQFQRLMEEILKNRSRLSVKTGDDEDTGVSALREWGNRAGAFVRRCRALLFAALVLVLFLNIRIGLLLFSFMTANPRKKAGRLWSHALRRLALAGLAWKQAQAEHQWVKELDAALDLRLYACYFQVSAARYAPRFSSASYRELREAYRVFSRRYAKAVPPGRRLLAWLVPPLALGLGKTLSRKTKAGPGKTPLMLLFIACLLFAASGNSQEPDSGDALYIEAMNAQDRENWDRAVQLFMEGSERYPYDPRFPWSLASLYYSRRLYRLAWDQFKKTEAILGDNAELLYQLSKTAALLNENAVSASYLERLLRLTPDNLNAVGDLGWIYYKLHRLNEGAALLLDALEFYGPDRNFSMTLGILYSDMFRYDDAKLRYLEAIAESGAVGDTVFSAVASYNLSILESRFYKYAAAADAAGASLAAADRASGHLAQGELRLRQLDLNGAFAEYQAAYERDPSPLSKLSLAQAYQAAGRLDEARLYAEDCLAQEDLSWMVNFGINPDQYRGDIHEILFNTYKGLENSERLRPCGSFAGRVQALARLVSYRFKKAVHGHLYHKYSLLTAQAYDRQGQKLDALGNYYKAFQAYRFRALDYLRQGRAYEVPLIPESLPSYETEEAGLLKKADKALALLDSFDPVWERDMSADALRIAALYGAKAQRQDAAERLYALNRGALRQEGIRLPVAVRGLAPRSALLAALNRAGFDCGGFFGGLRNNRFELRIRYNDNSLVWEIYDIQRGREALRRSLGPEELAALGSGGIRRNAALARAIADAAFRQ